MNKKKQLQPISGRKKKATPLPYLLLLPALALFTAFTYWPFLRTIIYSFALTDKKGNFVKWLGFKNYIRVFTNRNFGQWFGNTWYFAAMVCIGTLVVAMILALLSAEQKKGSRVYETLFSMPMAVASAPAATIFIFIMRKEGGILNQILGTNISWLNDPIYALESVAIVTVWLSIGSTFIFLLVGFRNVPDDLVESATLDGASYWKKFVNIYVPIASPQIFFVVFLNILNSYKSFALIKILVGTGPAESTNVLVHALYSNAFARGRFETACVYAMVLCLVIFLTTRIQFILEKKVVHYQ